MVVGAVGRQYIGGGFGKYIYKVVIGLRDLSQFFFGRQRGLASVFDQAIHLVEAGAEELVGFFPKIKIETHGAYRGDV
jgi:hypothetical protein